MESDRMIIDHDQIIFAQANGFASEGNEKMKYKSIISILLILAMLFALAVPLMGLAEGKNCPDHNSEMTFYPAKSPTCTEEGNIAYYVCPSDSQYFKEDGVTKITKAETVLKRLSHTLTHYLAVSATTSTPGNIEYWECSVCKKKFSDSNATTEVTNVTTTQVQQGTVTGTIVNCTSFVNVRAKATSNSTKLGTAKKGAVYTILGTSGNWTKIQYTKDKIGYVFSKYINRSGSSDQGQSETPASDGQKLRIVNCTTSVNVRSKATSESTKLGEAKKGAEYKLLSTVKNGTKTWYKVQYTSSKVGYIFGTYGKVISGSSSDAVIGTVKIINCDSFVNVRAKATSDSSLVGEAKKCATYDCLGKNGNWYKIQYTSKKIGYVFHTYVKFTSSGSDSGVDQEETGYGYVTGNTVNVRSGAGTDYSKLGLARINEVYEITAKNGKWYRINYNGKTGYISSVYFNKVISSKKTATIINCETSVNVRAEATSSSKVLGAAALGKKYVYLKTSGNYYMISFNGHVGYVHKDYAQIS